MSTVATICTRDEINDLRTRAIGVMAAPAIRRGQLSASEAAHCLVGVMSWIQRRSSIETMQVAAAELVRHQESWSTSFGQLPAGPDGLVDEHVALLAVVCRGVIELAGAENLRAALAFWATESDPAIWRKLFVE